MIEVIKEILFWITLGCGSTCLVLFMLCAAWKCFCLFLDHCKNANALRKMIKYYVEHHGLRILKEEDINLKKMRIEKK